MVTAPEETPQPKPERVGPLTMAVAGTVLLHLLLALFAAARFELPVAPARPELVAEAPGPDREQQTKLKKEQLHRQVDQVLAQAPPMTQVVRSEALAPTAVPEMRELLPGPVGLGEADQGLGFGAGAFTNMGRGAVFFGQKVTGRMGVVFDVSLSMQEFLPLVIDEITRVFRQATVVCCSFAPLVPPDGKPEAVRYRDATPAACMLPSYTTQAARAMHDDLLGLPNCWFLRREFNHLGAGIEFLINEKVNTIFVFSDFQDTIIPEYVDELVDKARPGKVKIHIQVLEKVSHHEQDLADLCKRTGGKLEEGELLRRAKRR